MFDIFTLRAEIVSIWGEHGAHAEVFDDMVKRHAEALRQLAAATARAEGAERERDDMLIAFGWKPGPFTDEVSRKVILSELSLVRPEMAKARKTASEYESDHITLEYWMHEETGLLKKVFEMMKEHRQKRRDCKSERDALAARMAESLKFIKENHPILLTDDYGTYCTACKFETSGEQYRLHGHANHLTECPYALLTVDGAGEGGEG